MSFFSAFTGADAKSHVKKSSAEAINYLDTGATAARGDITTGADKAYGYIDPFVSGGARANDQYLDYIGANGPEAQARAYAAFQHDPGFEAELQGGINALDRSATARGGLYSGAAMKGVADYGRTKIGESFSRRINHLAGAAGQGFQAAGAGASIASNTGNMLGNLSFGLGQQKASNAINKGNAMAQASNIGVNNFLNLAGTAAKAFAASDIRVKRDIERVGELPSGLPVYSFRYIWSDEPQIGVMAQEAREMFPDAVAEFNGVLHVDYNAIG